MKNEFIEGPTTALAKTTSRSLYPLFLVCHFDRLNDVPWLLEYQTNYTLTDRIQKDYCLVLVNQQCFEPFLW